MNGIENIKKKILDEANEAAKAALSEAEAEAAAIKAEAEKAVEKEKTALLEKGKKAAEESRRRIVSAAALEQRKAVLNTKHELIEEAFAKANEKLAAISGDDYKKLLVRLVVANSSTGKEELVFPAEDKAIAADVLAEANKELNGSLTLSAEAAAFAKGVLLRDGNTEVNCSLETLVDYMKEELTAQVAGLLFD